MPFLNDMILVTTPPTNGAVLSTQQSELVAVHDAVDYKPSEAGSIQTGDRLILDGQVYTITSSDTFYGEATSQGERGDEVTDVKGAVLELTGPKGEIVNAVIPVDGVGDLTSLSSISFKDVSDRGDSVFSDRDFETNENVTLGGADPESATDFTLNDVIILKGTPQPGDAFSVANGDITSVADAVSAKLQDPNHFQEGDQLDIDGVTYTITSSDAFYARATLDGAKDGEYSESKGALFELTSETGKTLTVIVPVDDSQSLANITQLDFSEVQTGGGDMFSSERFSTDQDVSIGGREEPPVETTSAEIHDVIVLGSRPVTGDTFDTSKGDLTEVVDSVQLSLKTEGQIQEGDTIQLGGTEYSISSVDLFYAQAKLEGAKEGEVSDSKGAILELTSDSGGTLTVIVPVDYSQSLSNIESLSFQEVSTEGGHSFETHYFDGNEEVTLSDATPEPTSVQINDVIQIDGMPRTGEESTVGEGTLTSVSDGIQFQVSDPSIVGLGDTFIIDGKEYTITQTNAVSGTATYDNPKTEGIDTADVKAMAIEGTGPKGETIELIIPHDGVGDLPDLSGISYRYSEATESSFDLNSFVQNDSLSITQPATSTDTTIHDVIQIDGLPVMGTTGTVANGDLINVTDGITFSTADPTQIQLGDTATIGGQTYTVIGTGGFKGEVTHDDPNTPGIETQIIKAATFELEDSNGDIFEYAIPYDGAGDLENIQSIEYLDAASPNSPWQISEFTSNDTVTFAPVAPQTAVFDLIEVNSDLPLVGETNTVGNGGLVEVDEPVAFSTATTGQISVGDTTVVGGTTFSVTQTQTQAVEVIYDNGASSAVIKMYTMELSDGTDTFSYYAPVDGDGNLPNISSMTVVQVGNNGINVHASDIDDNDIVTLVCFAKGSRIATMQGEKRVEDMETGDLVLTQDNGYQPVRLIASTTVQGVDEFAPIRIKAGALSNHCDLLVSPQHRVLIKHIQSELLFGESEHLIPAKHLVNGTTIVAEDIQQVTYFHILFDSHEIIFAEGLPTESFHPGEKAVNSLESATRVELFKLFPKLAHDVSAYGGSARATLKARDAQMLQFALSA